jgi:hypothetical protein
MKLLLHATVTVALILVSQRYLMDREVIAHCEIRERSAATAILGDGTTGMRFHLEF